MTHDELRAEATKASKLARLYHNLHLTCLDIVVIESSEYQESESANAERTRMGRSSQQLRLQREQLITEIRKFQ